MTVFYLSQVPVIGGGCRARLRLLPKDRGSPAVVVSRYLSGAEMELKFIFVMIQITLCLTFRRLPQMKTKTLSQLLLNGISPLSTTDNDILRSNSTDSATLPKARQFMSLLPSAVVSSSSSSYKTYGNFRVLQFNMLADGLCGLRQDIGAFSRAKLNDVIWERRKSQLLHEILQYDPDVITLQECDHYYDCFLPVLTERGYDGLFAPKPASACLEVSENSDGCALFIRRSKLRILSSETLTFAFAKIESADKSGGNDSNDVGKIRPQNQVALISVCELITDDEKSPKIIICTTHLKAQKNIVGEIYRYKEIVQLLNELDRVFNSIKVCGNDPVVLLTGDLNATPSSDSTGYTSLAYSAVKAHHLGLRSVLNDDLVDFYSNKETIFEAKNIWTTWKARRKGSKEVVTKHCIDYIMYTPVSSEHRSAIRPLAALGLYASEDLGDELLPSSSYPSDHVAIAADLEIISRDKL